MVTNRVGRLASVLGVMIGLGQSTAARANPQILVLFDRSGSMTQLGSCGGGNSKASCKLAELASITGAFQTSYTFGFGLADYYYWEFRRRVSTPSADIISNIDATLPAATQRMDMAGAGGFVDTIQGGAATSAVNRLASDPPNDLDFTPLAQAYCRAVTFLQGVVTTDEKIIYLVTDGFQNPTSPIQVASGTDLCNGPDTTAGTAFEAPPYGSNPTCTGGETVFYVTQTGAISRGLLAGGWQANMLDMALSGSVHTPVSGTVCPTIPGGFAGMGSTAGAAFTGPTAGFPGIGLITNFADSSTFLAAKLALSAHVLVSATVPPAGSAGGTDSKTKQVIDFLAGLSQVQGGRLTIPGRSAGDRFATPAQIGDANNDGCVDAADVALLKRLLGQRVSASAPESFLADVNGDGVINDRDYFVTSANFGHGCRQSPGAVPPLANVLFGFGSLTDWSSSPPQLLALTGTKTQGVNAIKIGGTGYRAISSIPFTTSIFEGLVTAKVTKVAYDIFVPAKPRSRSRKAASSRSDSTLAPGLGEVELLVSCPSAGVKDLRLGRIDLAGKPLGAFSTVQFDLPETISAIMRGPARADFMFTLTVKSDDTGQIVDNLRFL